MIPTKSLSLLLLTPVVGLILLGLTYGNSWGWSSPGLLSVAGLAAACLGLLVYVERHSDSPLIDLDLMHPHCFRSVRREDCPGFGFALGRS